MQEVPVERDVAVKGICQRLARDRRLALGGIEADKLAAVREAGFAGAAVLGAVWQSPDPVAAFRQLQALAV